MASSISAVFYSFCKCISLSFPHLLHSPVNRLQVCVCIGEFSVTCSALMWHWLWSARMTAGLTGLKRSYASEAHKSTRVTAPELLGNVFLKCMGMTKTEHFYSHCIQWEIVQLNNKSENYVTAVKSIHASHGLYLVTSCFLSQLKITVIHCCKSLIAFKILFCIVIQCRAMH